MSYFAEVNENNIVQKVIAISQENIDTGNWGSPSAWVQTSYNTHGGKHIHPDTGAIDTKAPLRKNYAGVGYTYDASKDAFIAPQPYPSWTLDDDTCLWEPPTARPDDGKMYDWDEDNTQWVEIE
tara:strand:- start:1345 stop:1716 length:372 start_codon:yes stop_codon:yes gene_type:complete